MLRRTLLTRVHLFSALVPHTNIKGGQLTASELEMAVTALDERRDTLNTAELKECMHAMQSIDNHQQRRATIDKLSGCVDKLRADLYNKSNKDPKQRLQVHEAIMAAGFYQRVLSPSELHGESIRFVLHHYNFDVRRDTAITSQLHDSLLEASISTEESDELLRDVLLLERRLSGRYRLAPTGGRRWLVLGQDLSDMKTEAEVNRVLSIPAIKEVGNYVLTEQDTEKLWKTITIAAKAEEEPSFMEASGLQARAIAGDLEYVLRVQKPTPPLSRWDILKEKILNIWVIIFSCWIMFWIVDEEIITLAALIFLKHKQTKILEEEAAKTGGKAYIARSTGYNG